MLNRKQRTERTSSSTSHDTSLIARGTVIQGDLRFNGALHLDGRIEGAVLGEGPDAVFTLSESGQVHGDIRVPHAIINGQVQGDIHIEERLELAPQARIHGDVHYKTLEMAAGAQVNGRMSHRTGEAPRELPSPEELGEPVPA
ncbi:cytoskeletal protein CcmA (bactofilin family) [Dyella sp. SG562]|jgi:cytoskeletal protein CcmA (bactofilin family)|uniref:bactofilin family protein n=1 Tax=Dyella TaxID=231454 RepID=UPI001420E79C|nr:MULTISPECIES: polymer-forming cytoskeletal protein [unclassified Dyella]NII72541.1 cytoskeletal protein CcmA (bactofilin family) [Dyella sp. SG562]NKJ21930.1 cytoskeletal protein CcmA (bactofilin family) [Dyella sp. SG609]